MHLNPNFSDKSLGTKVFELYYNLCSCYSLMYDPLALTLITNASQLRRHCVDNLWSRQRYCHLWAYNCDLHPIAIAPASYSNCFQQDSLEKTFLKRLKKFLTEMPPAWNTQVMLSDFLFISTSCRGLKQVSTFWLIAVGQLQIMEVMSKYIVVYVFLVSTSLIRLRALC